MSSRPSLPELARRGTVHFMGVGGAGMSALAELVLRSGGSVTGCDLRPGPGTAALQELGARIEASHDAAHVGDAVALVVSSAIPADHPEVLAARDRGIPVMKRAVALGDWVNVSRVLAVAGTHGKTTTTAMVTGILVAAGMDPTGLVGGKVQGWQSNLRYGDPGIYVVEADEYDRSFHSLRPEAAVVTNLEADHLDVYGSLDGVREAFTSFARSVPDTGRVALCGDDHGSAGLAPGLGARAYTYGLGAGCQLRGVEPTLLGRGSRFGAVEDGVSRGEVVLRIPGIHNVRNALGAAALSRSVGIQWAAIREGLGSFRGVARRFEPLGEAGGVLVVDDYAHHPTEIQATLAAARAAYPERRIVAVFQPHLYTRTRDFAAEFGRALSGADAVWVLDVYPAREEPIPGVTGRLVVEAAEAAGARDVRYVERVEAVADILLEALSPGDVCLTMGAGSVETVGPRLVEGLREMREPAHA